MQMLDAVINLKDNFSNTLATIDNNAKNFQRTMQNTGRDVWRTGSKVEGAGKTMTKGLTVPLLGMAAGAVKVGMEFESSMSEVAATMGITVDEIENGSESFELLKETAREMGKTTQYSSSEAAEALNYLALAGYDAEKSAEMLPKVLDLAAAGGLELAHASDLVTDSMEAMGLTMDQADTFIDQMAKTAQKSNTDVAQLGEAILVVGANGRELAGGTQELNTAIGLLGNAGIKGAEAGTKLRNIIMAMTPTTAKASEAFEQLGVDSYDAQGNLRPLNETMLDISKSMEGMSSKEKTELLSQIFNKQDLAAASTLLASVTQDTNDLDYALEQMGISTRDLGINLDDMIPIMESVGSEQEAVNYIMDQFGTTTDEAQAIYEGLMGVMGDESAWEKLEGHIGNAEGTAKEMADTLMHNLRGAFIKIKSALSGFGETVYDVIKPSLETAAEYVQKFIDKLNGLSEEQVETLVQVAKWIAIAGPVLLAIGKITKVVGKGYFVFADLAGAISKAGGVMKWLSSPAMIIVGVLAGMIAVGILLWKNWDTIREKAEEIFPGISETITTVLGTIKDVVMNVIEVVGEIVSIAFEALKTAVRVTLEFIGQFWAEHGESIKEIVSLMWELIQELFALGAEWIQTTVANALEWIREFWSNHGETITTIASAMWDLISGIIDGAMTFIQGVISVVLGIIQGDWDRVWEGIKLMFQGVMDAIIAAWNAAKEVISSAIEGVVDAATDKFHSAVDKAREAWQSLKDFLSNPIKGTVNAVKKGAGWVKDKIGNNYMGTDHWRGGPTWVHEKGPEIIDLPSGSRVYPHSKSLDMARSEGRAEASKTGGGITVSVTGNTFHVRKESDIDAIASELANKLTDTALNMA